MARLQDKTCVVTGAASGIGLAIARQFHAEGAQVILTDCDSGAGVAAAATIGCRFAVLDVREEGDWAALAAQAPVIDVLVNNAGVTGFEHGAVAHDPEHASLADWRAVHAVNLDGTFLGCRYAIGAMKEQGTGSIINISSVAGRLGFARRLPYASTKWAMIGFTESLAKELGPSGIRVNALLPGIVEGPRIEGVFQARAESEGVPYEEVRDRVLNNVSMKRMVSAGDVAEMAVFLCSEAGKNISGQSISVCGNVENL